MTLEEAIHFAECLKHNYTINFADMEVFCDMVIRALEQEPRKDEVILTNKEYRELMANEYDHGYCKGYAVALEEQESILNKIRAEIAEYGSIWAEYKITGRRDKDIEQLVSDVLSQAKKQVLEVIDKYKGESEVD